MPGLPRLVQVKRCSNQGSVHAALALLVASSPRGEPTLLFAVARWVAKLKFLVGNTESIFLSLSLGCIHTASVCCRRVLALSLPLSTQHHSHSCRFAGTKRSSRLPLGCSRYRGPAVVLRVLLWLHIVHLLASHFAPLSFPARENARNLHACIHIRTPVCTALLHRLFFCPRLLCVRPCYRSRWTCAWKMLMRVSWLTKLDRAACFSFSPLHTHARTHAHTRAHTHTHTHAHTHTLIKSLCCLCSFFTPCFLVNQTRKSIVHADPVLNSLDAHNG